MSGKLDMPVDNELVVIAEEVEAAGMEALTHAVDAESVAVMGLEYATVGSGVIQSCTLIQKIMVNRVFALGLRGTFDEEAVQDAVTWFTARGIVNFAFQPSPLCADQDRILRQQGLVEKRGWMKVHRGREPVGPVETDLRIEEIGLEQREAFARIVSSGFGLPPILGNVSTSCLGREGWHYYMAFHDETPVATGLLFLQNDVGWLSFAATDEHYRRRGAQGGLMARRINDAIDAGCRHIVTEADRDVPDRPNPSYHNMVRLGFNPIYLRPNYCPPT